MLRLTLNTGQGIHCAGVGDEFYVVYTAVADERVMLVQMPTRPLQLDAVKGAEYQIPIRQRGAIGPLSVHFKYLNGSKALFGFDGPDILNIRRLGPRLR